jgi:hypothetical protein
MKMQLLRFSALVVFSMFALRGACEEKHTYKPESGYVPDAKTAIAIAVAVWNPIYGEDKIKEEKPYKAELREGVWYVSGSLKEGWVGGVAEAEILKNDGHIIRISHGK